VVKPWEIVPLARLRVNAEKRLCRLLSASGGPVTRSCQTAEFGKGVAERKMVARTPSHPKRCVPDPLVKAEIFRRQRPRLFPLWNLPHQTDYTNHSIGFPQTRLLFKIRLKSRQGGRTTVTLLDEPKGWRKLQAMAQRENDPQKLASIIDQMNQLLDEHERMAADRSSSAGMSRNRVSDNPIKLDVELWQFEA